MKNAEMLRRCYELSNYLPNEERAPFDFAQKHPAEVRNVAGALPGLGSLLALLMHELREDINADEARAAGRLSPLKAAQRILKAAQDCPREALHGAWIAGGLQCMCDGYRAFRLVEHLPGLPAVRDGLEPFNVAGCIDPARDGFTKPLQLPELAEVKAYVKAEKARRKGEGIKNAGPVCWDFGEGLPYVDALYLIDALELLPGCTCRISERRPELGGLYLESPAGDGLVMAKRRPKKAE